MKRTILISAALMAGLAPGIAHADPKSLTVAQCLQVLDGLTKLDGYDRPGGAGTTRVPYKLGGAVRFQIAQAITTLRPFADSTEKARVALLEDIGRGKQIEPGSPELSRLNIEYSKVLESPCGAQLTRIKLSDLRLGDDEGQNPVPPGILSQIMAVIDPDK